MKETVLITGANGQIGTVLVQALIERYGYDCVLATDIATESNQQVRFERLDVLDASRFTDLVTQYQITQIYHLAAILSASGEKNPLRTWEINMTGFFNVMETARKFDLKVFYPSSIAVFGENLPPESAPQYSPLIPTTVYGISKAAGENWAYYYRNRYGIDVRSLRYPGIIGHRSKPGGGTTDYAVDIFHEAILNKTYTCFLAEDATLPMIYMEDAIRATLELMEAPKENLTVSNSYNLAGLSFSPAELAEAIKKEIPDFTIQYKPDFRQKIAESWPKIIDDSEARQDWNWQPKYDLEKMTKDMIFNLKKQLITTVE
ncbi:MAG: NAD-dependent epimerase/dehydratase family protein [Saprospiraceae bacterium]